MMTVGMVNFNDVFSIFFPFFFHFAYNELVFRFICFHTLVLEGFVDFARVA